MNTLALAGRPGGFLRELATWFDLLERANGDAGIYDGPTLHRFLQKRLLLALTYGLRHRREVLTVALRRRIWKGTSMRSFLGLGLRWLAALGGILPTYAQKGEGRP